MVGPAWGLSIIVMLHRNPENADLIDYSVIKHWYTGRHTDRPAGRKHHDALLAEGSFVYPEPVHEAQLVLEGLSAHVRKTSRPDVPLHTPGRERSGVDNVEPQVTGQLPLPLEPVASTEPTSEQP